MERFRTKDFDLVLRELRAGIKESHWMWWAFPVPHGSWGDRDVSPTTRLFALKDTQEAQRFVSEFSLYYKAALEIISSWGLVRIKTFFGPIDTPKFRCHIDFFHRHRREITADKQIRDRLEAIHHKIQTL
jgi:uncharacterized protein (DUF1810 family)